MQKLSNFAEEYLLLALRINKHIKGYVDFYIGPDKLQQKVDKESIIPPKKLLNDLKSLLEQLHSQCFDDNRERYLEKMLVSMRTSIEILNLNHVSIQDQFFQLYDIVLSPVKENELEDLKEEVKEAYGDTGSLEERFEKLRMKRRVPEEKVFEYFKRALTITKNRTEEFFAKLLPENEQILIDITKERNNENIKWTCYEWYLGNYVSRLEVNPKFNVFWTALLTLSAHEGYPGHHTEFSIKEWKLFRELNQFEHSILLLNSPKLIISEGIADIAINVLFTYRDQVEIGLNEFCPDILNEDSLETLILQQKVRQKLTLFWYNFAYFALVKNYSDKDLIRYGKSFEIFSDTDLRNQLKRLKNPVYSKNAFTYNLGMNLIKNKYGEFPSVKDFRSLLVNPILPSDLL
jgi:hypothetical protein